MFYLLLVLILFNKKNNLYTILDKCLNIISVARHSQENVWRFSKSPKALLNYVINTVDLPPISSQYILVEIYKKITTTLPKLLRHCCIQDIVFACMNVYMHHHNYIYLRWKNCFTSLYINIYTHKKKRR